MASQEGACGFSVGPQRCRSLDEPGVKSSGGARRIPGRSNSVDSGISFNEPYYQTSPSNLPLNSISEETSVSSEIEQAEVYNVPKGSESSSTKKPLPPKKQRTLNELYEAADKAYDKKRHAESRPDSGISSDSSQRPDSEVFSEIDTPEMLEPVLLNEGLLSLEVKVDKGAKSYMKRWFRLTKRNTREGFIRGELTCYYDNKSLLSRLIIRGMTLVSPAESSARNTISQNIFVVRTKKGKFSFTAESQDEMTLWIKLINEVILLDSCVEEWEKDGGELYDPIKKGSIVLKSIQPIQNEFMFLGPQFVAIKDHWLCIYEEEKHFNDDVPMIMIQMGLAYVETSGVFDDVHELVLRFGSSIELCFSFDSAASLAEWQCRMEEAIAEGRRLQPRSVWFRVRSNPSNRACADCGQLDPEWVVLNWGIVVCRNCCVAHREVGFLNLRFMSLKTEIEDWRAEDLGIISTMGNEKVADLLGRTIMARDSSQFMRKNFVIAKYKLKSFCDVRRLLSAQDNLDTALAANMQTSDLMKTLQLIVSGANIIGNSRLSAHSSLSTLALSFGQNYQAALIELHSNQPKLRGIFSTDAEPTMREILTYLPLIITPNRKTKLFKKTKQKPKVNSKQFCVCHNGSFKCFENPDSLEALYSMSLKDASFISEIIDKDVFGDRDDLHGFLISTLGQMQNYATETSEKKVKWMRSLALNILPTALLSVADDGFQRFGKLNFKMNDALKLAWVVLKDNFLWVFEEETKSFTEIDLRKDAKECLGFDPDDHKSIGIPVVYLEGFQILFKLPDGGCICLQAENKNLTEDWLRLILRSRKAGNKIEDQMLSQRNVPVLLETCLDHILSHGIESKGIFRHSGDGERVTRLLAQFHDDASSVTLRPPSSTNLGDDNNENNIFDVADTVKKFLCQLPEPLLKSSLRDDWFNLASSCHNNNKKTFSDVKNLLRRLPLVNHATLKMLSLHLVRIASKQNVNLMSLDNLSAIMGPILISGEPSRCLEQKNILLFLLLHRERLFDVTAEEAAKERSVFERILRIRELR